MRLRNLDLKFSETNAPLTSSLASCGFALNHIPILSLASYPGLLSQLFSQLWNFFPRLRKKLREEAWVRGYIEST